MSKLRNMARRWLGIAGDAKEQTLLSLVNAQSHPNLNELMIAVRDIEAINMNIKAFGYDLARRLAQVLPVPTETAARHVGLACKSSTQADIESDWVAHWCGQLQTPVVYHRKVWEFCYALQAMFEEGHLRPGGRALGFGCGTEVIPSYLASQGVAVTMTDLPAEDARSNGWAATNQHTLGIEQAYHANLVTRETFDASVSLRHVDMNAIPDDLTGYDFCWSICALEHLGSIAQGLAFVENSLKTLRPGGLSVHTTEYNIKPEGPTIDNWPTVLFQRHHLEQLAERLTAQGHYVAPFDFTLGDKPMDLFIDLPPWPHNLPNAINAFVGEQLHLKLNVDGFPCTCFGLIVRKAS